MDNKNNGVNLKLMNRFLSPQFIQFYFDASFIILSYYIYYFIKYETGWFYNPVNPGLLITFIPSAVILIYWIILFWFAGLYRDWYIRSPFDEFFSIFRMTFIGSFLLFILIFFDSPRSPRLLFLIYFAILTVSVGFGRLLARNIQKKLRIRRKYVIDALLIGTINDTKAFVSKIEKSPAWGYSILGIIEINNVNGSTQDNLPEQYLGKINELEHVIKEFKPSEVLIITVESDRSIYMKIANLCSEYKVIVKIIPDLYDIFTGSARTLPIYGIPLIEINTQLLKPWESFIKRITDIIVSSLVILLGSPIWIIVGLIIKFESKGRIFYTQPRVGKDGKVFKIFKFRTMVQRTQQGSIWTQVNDPRVTKFGFFLRKSHIDEVPQFWNCLKGEMSIVGPRPEQPVIVDKYAKLVPFYVRRLSVRPGITGWWQVNYTSYKEDREEIESRLKDDFFYIENMSLKLDLEIMVRTAFLMIKGHGQT